MSDQPYTPPVDQLLTYGDCRKFKEMPDYLALGFGEEHIPELIRMATDPKLNQAQSDSLEVWAPIHTWRTLGQLKAQVAIQPLMNLWHENPDDDWTDELKQVFANIGPVAIPYLKAYLAEPAHGLFPRAHAVEALPRMAEQHPETRETCVAILTEQLEKFEENDRELNAFIIWALTDDLKAVDAAPLMEKAFEAKRVDKTIVGNWYSVQVTLGLKPPNKDLETDEEMEAEFRAQFGPLMQIRDLLSDEPSQQSATHKPNPKAKAKAKRKMAKQSRRKNRKRR